MKGKLLLISDTQTFPSGFSKREFVIETEEDKYPQQVKFNALKEKGDLLNDLKEGDRVSVHFDIKGREYNGRHFVDLNAWRIELDGSEGGFTADQPPMAEDTTDYSAADDEPPF